MKQILIGLSLLNALSFGDLRNEIMFDKEYVHSHEIASLYYDSESLCVNDGGKWASDVCVQQVNDSIRLGLDSLGVQQISITTVSSNAHICSFDGPAIKIEDTYISQVFSDEFNPSSNDFEKKLCEVRVKISEKTKSASLTNNGNCQSFCGLNAELKSSTSFNLKPR